jgi:hypothetical protein
MFCEMADELRNLRVHNRLSSQLLSRLLDLRHWNELKLAERSGIAGSLVSAHLSGQRPIGPQHLAAYLRVLDRQDRAMFLDAWLRDHLDGELIADLLDGTKTDSMPALEENQRRMLDWWATAIARDSKLAKIFSHLTTKAGFNFPSLLLLPVSTAAAQFQSWLSEIASSGWHLVRSACPRAEQALVTIAGILALLFQDAKAPVATSIVATSIVAPALASSDTVSEPNDLAPPPQRCSPSRRPGASSSVQASSKRRLAAGGSTRRQVSARPLRVERTIGRQVSALPLRVERTIGHQWRRLAAARKSAHSAFIRLVRDAHPQQSKQKHRKQRRS